MIIIKDINQLEEEKKYINKMLLKKENYQLSYENLYALYKSHEINTFISDDFSLITSFKHRDNEIEECCMNINPIYTNNNYKNIENFIEYIYTFFNKTLYFPLVYQNSAFLNKIKNNKKFEIYERLYTSIVEPNKINNLLEFIGYNKYFSIRNIKKFEKKLKIKYFTQKNVKEILSFIEEKSWKSDFGQDMNSNYSELIYYNELIEQGIAQIAVAMDDDKPIAYRIDAIFNGEVRQLKTSYCEEYKKYSPGTYLTIYDMFNNQKKYKMIDLYGGPNLVKNLIETKRIKRYDICFGDINVINKLKQKRQSWDERNYTNFKNNKGIRNIYKRS